MSGVRMYPGISIVTLGVADVDRSSRFYERFGWRRSQAASNEAISFFALDNIVLAIFARTALAHDSGLADDDRTAFSGLTLAQNYASIGDVDAAFELAVQSGGRALVTPQAADWGGYHAVFADPDGHVWELAFNPFLTLTAEGKLVLPP